jgi:hypothetical protein
MPKMIMTATLKMARKSRSGKEMKNGEDKLPIKRTIAALGFAVAALGIVQPAFGQQFSLRAAHYFKDDHPWNKGW